jgi:signal transduction histidine kinase
VRSLRVASSLAAALVAVAAWLRLRDGDPAASFPASLEPLLPVLIAAASLCVVGLTLRRAPSVAWFGAATAAALSVVEIISVVRNWQPGVGVDTWRWLVLLGGTSMAVAASAAAGFALASRRHVASPSVRRAVSLATGVALGGVLVAGAWAAIAPWVAVIVDGPAPVDLWPIRVATRVMLVALVGLILVGSLEVVGPPAIRARRRLAVAVRPGVEEHGLLRRYAGLLGEELVPAVAAGRRGAAEAERERLAADLHATVVPELRRAVAAASVADGSVAERLRTTLDDVETLMASRHSIVLDGYGLMAALEWLAERTEERAGIGVTIEVAPETSDARPPLDVERAAFRVAVLAIDNVVRHASGSAVSVTVRSTPSSVGLEVLDRGPGFDAAAAAAERSGHRGIADMRAEAAAVGARLSIEPAAPADPASTGTRVGFAWPAT